MTAAGTGAIQIEILQQSKTLEQPKLLLTSEAFCCSGRERCIVKKRADPKKHTCPICKQAVHAPCEIPNPDFENNKVGLQFLTNCWICSNVTGSKRCKPCSSQKGTAYKRPDGQWNVCIGNEDSFYLSQEEIMDQSKYFVTAYLNLGRRQKTRSQNEKGMKKGGSKQSEVSKIDS